MSKILDRVKSLENQGYEFEAADGSFDLLVRKVLGIYRPLFQYLRYHCDFMRVRGGNRDTTEAVVLLSVGEEVEHTVAEGDGPVNALDCALRKALVKFYPDIQERVTLVDYKVRIINGVSGTAAKTRVLIVSPRTRDLGNGGRFEQHHRRELAGPRRQP